MGHHRLDPLGILGEDFECNNGSRTAAKDDCWFVRQMLDQTSDIIGIGREPVIRVLRPVEVTPGKPWAVIGHHLVLCRKVVCERTEGLSVSPGPWDQNQEWPIAASLIKQLHTGNFEGMALLKHRIFLAFSLRAKSSQSLAPRLYALVSAFVCTDKANSWESREAWGLHLLRFHLLETSVRDDGSQILYAAPSGMKARSLTRSFLLVLEISVDQSPPRFEHTGDFSESLTFEGSRQMMHHQGREHHIKCLIGEGEMLNHSNLEIDGQVAPSSF